MSATLMECESPVGTFSLSPGGESGKDLFGDSWRGRRVTIIGLGKSGLAAAALLSRIGARVSVSDQRDRSQLQAIEATLSSLRLERIELGRHTKTLIEESDCLVVSPGVPEDAAPMRWALERRLPILSEVELAFRFCPSPIVAVTGTNGKSTTVTLIEALLKASHRPAIACGNLGVPFASVIEGLKPETVVVLEVSSFQLLWCERFRPWIGVLLNIGTNHLDRHHDRDAYVRAKARLFRNQQEGDWALLNRSDPLVTAVGRGLRAQRVWFGENDSNPPRFWLAPETHRALTQSDQALLQVARLLDVPDPLAWQVLRTFQGLEHRLERVATIRGVRFVNDSKSTTPESLLFALAHTPGEIIPILGGRDKGLDFNSLVGPLQDSRVKGVVLVGESRPRLRSLLKGSLARPLALHEGQTLEEAVAAAADLAKPGATVLFSPACASFDMFRDFEDRGRAFKAIVHRMESAEARGRAGIED